MINPASILHPKLYELRDLMRAQGWDLRLVGGCVRDLMLGLTPKDVDLHTDATPDQQIQLYTQNQIRFEPTGLQHGTLSVIIDHVAYEITSLRVDTQTDGRHATVEYTQDQQVLNPELLRKFEDLGYSADQEYDVEELTHILQRINQSS